MNPTLRLTWRLAPYMFFALGGLLLVALELTVLILIGVHGLDALTVIGTIYLAYVCKMIVEYMGGNVIVNELGERNGKPIKVFRPGKKNIRFLKKLGWYHDLGNYYPVLVNPREGKFSLTKHLFMLEPGSEKFSDQLLEVAATNAVAYEEIAKKVQTSKYCASSDLRKFEKANAISESIKDIVK